MWSAWVVPCKASQVQQSILQGQCSRITARWCPQQPTASSSPYLHPAFCLFSAWGQSVQKRAAAQHTPNKSRQCWLTCAVLHGEAHTTAAMPCSQAFQACCMHHNSGHQQATVAKQVQKITKATISPKLWFKTWLRHWSPAHLAFLLGALPMQLHSAPAARLQLPVHKAHSLDAIGKD